MMQRMSTPPGRMPMAPGAPMTPGFGMRGLPPTSMGPGSVGGVPMGHQGNRPWPPNSSMGYGSASPAGFNGPPPTGPGGPGTPIMPSPGHDSTNSGDIAYMRANSLGAPAAMSTFGGMGNEGGMGGPMPGPDGVPPMMNGENMEMKNSPANGGPATPRDDSLPPSSQSDYNLPSYPDNMPSNDSTEASAILKIKETMQEEAKRFEKDTPDGASQPTSTAAPPGGPGVLSLKWNTFRSILSAIGDGLKALGEYSDEGSKFLFGEKYKLHSFAMEVMPRMIFFNGLSKVLERIGFLQWGVSKVGALLHHLLSTTAGESFLAGANIFLGPENSIQLVQPMIAKMSRSEIHTVMSCGLAAIDAGMVAVYVNIGISGRHLITASLLSAPAALGLSKLLIGPDIINSSTLEYQKPERCSITETFRRGAAEAVKMICRILATLMAFIALVSFINSFFAWMSGRVGLSNFTLQKASSYILYPLIYLSGIDRSDCLLVGELFATKTFINEFVAYTDLKKLIDNRLNGLKPSISERSESLATFALCGFSNFGTLGTNVGFLCAIAPHKTAQITGVAVRAFIAGNFACLLTAAVAGLVI
ncbi:DgyrCDS1168 [Dimorphilus gyrociliatus]|uniref:DgyrCDS1168 n=1 Tax=Dimorphilus gyrociliatus TaxID=2664684 RepID=A0A7I8V6S1_9ANNE|nr:DgyrCDS1168 [Dimorphilus gyrociliatus]